MVIPTGANIGLKIFSMKKNRGIPPATANPTSSTALNVFYKQAGYPFESMADNHIP